MLRVLGLEVLGVLGVFTSESVGGQMSTEGERERRDRGRGVGVESAVSAGSETETEWARSSNNPPTLHTPCSSCRNCFQYLDSNMLLILIDKDEIIEPASLSPLVSTRQFPMLCSRLKF